MQYKYLGEKTVHMNRCVLSVVQAAMTNATLTETKTVIKARCCLWAFRWPCLYFFKRSRLVADTQKSGPAQLLTRIRNPTATTLKPPMPLYALDRSTDEMALEPPKAKKDVYCSKMEVMVISSTDKSVRCRHWSIMVESRKTGMLVARDWVMANKVHT